MKARSRIRGSAESEPPSQSVASAVGFLSPRSGLPAGELGSQAKAIDQVCTALGLRVVELIHEEDATNGGSAGRPSLERALGQVEAGEVSCLVVHDLEQLSQSVDEFASVIDRLECAGARLVALNVGLDTASSSGRLALERRRGTRPDTAVYAPEPVEPEPVEPEPVEPEPAAAPAVVTNQALGYSTADSDEGVEAIRRRCADLGLGLVEVVREGQVEGKALDRPGLSGLIERVAAGEADCLVVGSLGQLSHSVAELGAMVNWLERNQIRLVTVDLELDTASSGGRLTVRALASVAGLQRDRLSERTRKGLAAAQAKRAAAAEAAAGGTGAGWPEVSKRIAAMRQDGMTLQAIADVLNAEGVPTPRGGAQWRPSSVQTAAGYKRRSRAKKADQLPPVQRPPSGP